MIGLWGIVSTEGITVDYSPLNKYSENLYGIYYRDPEIGPVIILDPTLDAHPRLHRCILAEEIGHHFTLTPEQALIPHASFSYSRSHKMSRAEERALRWACNYLMPSKRFLDALRRGYRRVHELADYFYVTEWLVYRKFELMRSKVFGQVVVDDSI